MDLGWYGLSPGERLAAIVGGAIGLGAWATLTTAVRTLFGGLALRRRQRRKRRKPRRRR